MPALYPPAAVGEERIGLETVERIAQDSYGIRAKATRLGGEKDENFQLDAGASRYAMKVAPASEPRQFSNLITATLTHLAHTGPDLPVERIILAKGGDAEVIAHDDHGEERLVRVTSFLEGQPLAIARSTPKLRREFGEMLARIGIALRDFDHPSLDRELVWDMQHAHRTRPMLEEIGDPSEFEPAARCLEMFELQIKPRMADLPAQAAHNDFNPNNVLVSPLEEKIAGVLDFGDVTRTQRVNDLAIAASEQLTDCDDPLQCLLDVVAGYCQACQLQREELELIYDLVRVRLAVIAVAAEWRARAYPDNEEFQARRAKGERSLRLLARLPDDEEFRQAPLRFNRQSSPTGPGKVTDR